MAISLENGQIDAFNFKLTSEKISLDSNPSSGDYYLKVGDENNHISFSADNELSIKAKKFELSSGSWGGTNLLSNTEPFEPRGDLIEKDWTKNISGGRNFSNSWISGKKENNSGL
jgi:hypothetical protein